jgi:hypothetical protein
MKFIQSKYLGYSTILFFVFFLVWSFGPMMGIEKKLENTTGTREMLDLKPASNSEEIYRYVSKIGEPGHKVLAEMYTFQDLIYPLVYGPVLWLGLLYVISRSFPGRKKLTWLSVPALLMMIADYLENFSILLIISNPTEKLALAGYVGIFTAVKWILGFVSVAFLVVFGLIFTIKKFFRKGKA